MLSFDKFMKSIAPKKRDDDKSEKNQKKVAAQKVEDERRRHYLTRFREKWQNRITFRKNNGR